MFSVCKVTYEMSSATFSLTTSRYFFLQRAPYAWFSRRKVEVSQRGCRRIRRGQERWVSACSPLVPGWLPEAVAGWEPERAAGSGSPQTDRGWRHGLPQGTAGE